MLVTPRHGWPHLRSWHQAFGGTLQLKQVLYRLILAVSDGHQVRNLPRKTFGLLVNLAADFEKAEALEMLAVLDDVPVDAGKERFPHQRLVRRDGVRHAQVV